MIDKLNIKVHLKRNYITTLGLVLTHHLVSFSDRVSLIQIVSLSFLQSSDVHNEVDQ